MADGLNETCQQKRLEINIEKTVVMGVTKRSESLTVSISLGGVNLKKK